MEERSGDGAAVGGVEVIQEGVIRDAEPVDEGDPSTPTSVGFFVRGFGAAAVDD